MRKIFLLLLLTSIFTGFSSKVIKNEKKQPLTFKDCKGSFSKNILKEKTTMDQLITAYQSFPCFPLESLTYLFKEHPLEHWLLSEIAKLRILSPLTNEDELKIISQLLPYIKENSEIEKYLLKSINIKNQLSLSAQKELSSLWSKFPSHNPNRLKAPNFSVVKDLNRRGQNNRALDLLKILNTKHPSNLKFQKAMVSTQKKINRNVDYLMYSQKYIDSIYKRYRKNRSSSYYKELYLTEALENIRRIWTYQSTNLALNKLTTLIKFHCNPVRMCSEHYWVKGRIYEDLSELKKAHTWLKKAVQTTPLTDPEYQNRVWNLVWLESKLLGSKQALSHASFNLTNISEKKILPKLYYWMYRWSDSEQEKNKYLDLITKHHPMSFYLWSKFAIGKSVQIKAENIFKFKKSLSTIHEKNLLHIMESKELSLAQAYIKHIQNTKKFKKTLSWKKLKALNGMYADLFLDLKAGKINISRNLQFFFSRGFSKEILLASLKFSIKKELIWSIIKQESNFNPYARSWADAFGLMQILPKRAINFLNDTRKNPNTAPIQAINPFKLYNPIFNIFIGAWLLRENLRNFDEKLPLAIAAYNASINKVEEWERRFYKGDWMLFIEEITYRETRQYVKLVLRNKEIYTALEKSSALN